MIDQDNIDQEDEMGRTVLYRACLRNDLNLAELLVKNGANVSKGASRKGNDTPLLRACYAGQKNVIEMLLNAGADLQYANKNGETPICCILKSKDEEISKLIPENLRSHNCRIH